MPPRLPYERGFYVSWDQLHRDARALAWRLQSEGPTDGFRALVAITRGGLAPAMIVARELDIRTIETLSVKSYAWQEKAELRVLKPAAPEVMGEDGAGVLIIDDLVDTGRTLAHIRRLYPRAFYATVYAKPQGRPLVDAYVTEVSQDTWIYFPWDLALQYVEPIRPTGA